MRKFAKEVSQLVHDIGRMDVISVKIASENGSMEAQQTCARVSSKLYDVMQKRASEECDGDVCLLVEKMASALNLPQVPVAMRVKLAAAIAVDTTLASQPVTVKTASAKMYGREFIAELLREVL